jgi:hypothetical protein
VVNAKIKRVGYLRQTSAGKIPDKKLVATEAIGYPRAAILDKDPGFQGYEPDVAQTHQPKPRTGELPRGQKRHKRKRSRGRVRVEPAIAGGKRSRSVKDCSRKTKRDFSDLVRVGAWGLHNLRVRRRKRRLRT